MISLACASNCMSGRKSLADGLWISNGSSSECPGETLVLGVIIEAEGRIPEASEADESSASVAWV